MFSCFITHYTLHITRYTVSGTRVLLSFLYIYFLLCTLVFRGGTCLYCYVVLLRAKRDATFHKKHLFVCFFS